MKRRNLRGLLFVSTALLQTALIPPTQAMAYEPAAAQVQPADLNSDLANDAPDRVPGQKPQAGSLEEGIWVEVAKAERAAKTSGERDLNPELDAYVGSVLTRVTGRYSGDVRVYVMDRPFFNASMAPNGYTEVWTGLLLRCEDEDQLAFVLGHELGHFRHSHSVKTYKAFKDGQNTALVATMALSVLAMGAAANASTAQAAQSISNATSGLIDVIYLGSIAAFMGYSRETEGQADTYGLIYTREAGYFPGAGGQIWQGRLDETAASDIEKVRTSPARINIFGDHPLEVARLTALGHQDKMLNNGTPSKRTPEEAKAARLAYRAHIRPYLSVWLRDDLRRQDFGQTLFVIDRLNIDGEDKGLLNFYAGEAYRLRGGKTGKPDLDSAITAYKVALENPDAPKETWRQLGDVYRRVSDIPKAIEAFNAYLKAAPDASDAWIVQDQLDTLAKADQPATSAAPAGTAPTSTGGPHS